MDKSAPDGGHFFPPGPFFRRMEKYGAKNKENLSDIYLAPGEADGEIWLFFALTVGKDYDKIYN